MTVVSWTSTTNSQNARSPVGNSQPPSKAPLKFYAAWYCPFAQRAWMALLHKGLAFEYIEVEPYRESRWWLEVSRNRAKVPVTVVPSGKETGATTVIDFTRINQHLEAKRADLAGLKRYGVLLVYGTHKHRY